MLRFDTLVRPRIRRLGLVAVGALVVAGLSPAGIGTPAAQADESPFTTLRGLDLDAVDEPRVEPEEFTALDVDLPALRQDLAGAPRAAEGRSLRGAGLELDVPDPDGGSVRFALQRTQLMEPGLAAANPGIATYAGRGVDDPGLTVVLDVTPMGFHAAVRHPSGLRSWYVDPATNERGASEHLAYYGAAVEEPAEGLVEPEELTQLQEAAGSMRAQAAPGGPVSQRVYRVAIVNDPSYAAYFGTENVTAEKVTLMNRVNQIYNDDLAIRMVLVDGTESLNLDTEAKATGGDGPCGSAPCYEPDSGPDADDGQLAGCGGELLGRNRTVLGQLIGADNYDIGHIVLGKNGGGIAYLGVVGSDYKGGGCTGLPFPEGDFFAIDYVAHEMGHQFGGPHTFDGVEGSCAGGNRTAEAAVEPGSGSSVMAYAGICGLDDLQPHTDPYFSQRTIEMVTDYATSDLPDTVEVQTVSLRDFDADGDSFELGFGDSEPVTITRGAATYSKPALEQAIGELTGREVTVAQWDYDPYNSATEDLAPVLPPDDRGFQVIFSGLLDPFDPEAEGEDVAPLTLAGVDDVTGFVGTTAQGGPTANGGDEVLASGNRAPRVSAPGGRVIPTRTPFTLSATGNDPDGDGLTYLWEQNDQGPVAGGTALASNTKLRGPLFRVFGRAADVSLEDSLETPSPGQNLADGSPARTFPDMAQVLAGNTNADTGRCPTPPATPPGDEPAPLTPEVRECFSEFLPTARYVGRNGPGDPALNFRVTARDGNPAGGGTASDDVRLRIDPSTGPFRVSSQAQEGQRLVAGTQQRVTWSVNRTDRLAAQVRITLSTDGGASFDRVLAARVPNNGSASVRLPAVATDEARIRVEAVGNYFFDVNDAEFAIVAGPSTAITSGPADGGFHLGWQARFGYRSDDPAARFRCRFDGRPLTCDDDGAVVRGLAPGTHRFNVAAVLPNGVADPTPATRKWATPLRAQQLNRQGGWTRSTAAGAYRGGFVRTNRQGASLRTRVTRAERLALVAARGPGFGRVAVFVNDRRVRTIDLRRPRFAAQQLIGMPPLPRATTGVVEVRTLDGRPVRIEGLGVLRQ